MVRMERVELSRLAALELNPACIPISPHPHGEAHSNEAVSSSQACCVIFLWPDNSGTTLYEGNELHGTLSRTAKLRIERCIV